MKINSEEELRQIIREDEWIMRLLKTVNTLQLPDWWICAGFVRSKIWDVIHGRTSRTPLPDIDVIYFDAEQTSELEEKKLEEKLQTLLPGVPWSVKNQARMHTKNDMPPYTSAVDGISKFPETVTALGVKLNEQDGIELTAPWGIEDVVNLEVRPTPLYQSGANKLVYEQRIATKNWQRTWEHVKVYDSSNLFIQGVDVQ